MRYPAFVEELGSAQYRRFLALGVLSGYVVTACFGALIAAGVATGILEWHFLLAVLIAVKLATNTAQLIAMRLERWVLGVGTVNVVTDVVVMTGAIWVTGDTRSPLVAIYVIEVSVLALLTNIETTICLGVVAVGLYASMAILTARGVLPRFATPAEWAGGASPAYIAMATAFTGFVIAAPAVYIAGILRRLRENERRLEARTRALIDAGKQRAQFMANVTHELRTPLQGITGLCDLVAGGVYGPTTERQREAMQEAKKRAKDLLQLIDDLIQVAGADAGKLELREVEVDLADVLPSAVSTIRWMLGGKKLSVDVALEPALPRLVIDRAKLNQVLLNLLSNAVKFTPDGGSLWLRARREADDVCIEVQDTGVGIEEDEQTRIFEEFYQVDGSASREFGGTGLGLALVRRLLDLMGGTISVTSTPGVGSTFAVRLPVSRAPVTTGE